MSCWKICWREVGRRIRRIDYSLTAQKASTMLLPRITRVGKSDFPCNPWLCLILSSGLEGQNRCGIAVIADLRGRVAIVICRRRFCFIDVSEPLAGCRVLTLGDVEVNLLNLLGNRSASAFADRDPVNGTDRRDLSG